MRTLALAAALIVTSHVAQAQAQARTVGAPDWSEFTRHFQAYVDSDGVVGAGVALVEDGRVVRRYDTGWQDRDAGVRADSLTIYHWGSITKSLTAIAIMQLRDRGQLGLGDPIVRWIPELRAVHDRFGMLDSITLRMLMSHTAGFQNPTWPYGTGRPWEPFEPTTWNQLVAMMPYQELLFRPGARYGYSNPGYVYLGRVVELVTGDPWDAYIQKNIFAPLDMRWSYFRSTPTWLAAHRSHNYTVRRDSSGTTTVTDHGADFDPGITSANGAWNAPIGDLVKYVAFLTDAMVPGMTRSRYDAVLSRTSLAEMWQPGMPMAQGYESSPDEWMGLGFFVLDRHGRRILGHTGSQAGFRSFYYFDPLTKRGVIAVFNTTNEVSPATTLWREIQDVGLELLTATATRRR